METHSYSAKEMKVTNNYYRGFQLTAEEETFLNLLRRQDKWGQKLLKMIAELIQQEEKAVVSP